MSDDDKTIVLDMGTGAPDYGNCPVCGQKFQPDPEDVELLRCPACNFVKKTVTIIEVGSVIAHKYRVLSYLNGGGYGSIYLCHPLGDISARYVLKVLKQPNDVSKKRFKREAGILSSLNNNKRIARIMDYWEASGSTYIVMEYINGSNLKELYKNCEFDEETVLTIAFEVARALQDIWNEFKIIHRDIKPENIMVDTDSHIKLLDFGLSKQYGQELSQTSKITMAHSSMGTPGYMSPEHFTNFKDVDFRSDIYSLGATLFYLLTGRESMEADSVMEYYNQTMAFSPPPVESFQNRCSEGCIRMIRKMMHRNIADRHHSYEELIAEITALLNGV